ncbi:hypothetical protein ACO1O0_002191 [Amphichorda felina]
MSQMRVKALKGEGKTVSRKARKSGRASGTASPGGSDILHKVFYQDDVASRSESEATPPETPPVADEDFFGGPGTPDDRELPAFDPKKLISELQDRKNHHNETRELLIDHYIKMLRNRYGNELDNVDTGELIGAFIRGASRGVSTRERSLSIEAYSLTICIEDLNNAEASRASLKQILTDDDNEDCQIRALYALTLTIVHYGGGEEDIFDYLDFLVEAIQSNGESVNAIKKDGVTVALFECWAYAATHVKSIWHQADYAMDAFVEKLDSTDAETQTAAAECIAYIFEASRAHEEEEGEPFELPYDPARVATRIQDLSKESSKSMSRKDRRDLRDGLRSVVSSLENGVGPYYSTAKDFNDREVGYRYRLRKGGGSSSLGYSAYVESWHHYHRITMLRNIFGTGLERHIDNETPMVIQCLEGLDWQFVLKTDSKTGGGPVHASYF